MPGPPASPPAISATPHRIWSMQPATRPSYPVSSLRLDCSARKEKKSYLSIRAVIFQALNLSDSRRRYLTLRINDVHVSSSREAFAGDLKSIIAADLILKKNIKTLSNVSLVRTNKRSACGTATFHTSLPDQELVQRLQGASKGKEHPYTFDCDFYGITPLYEHETDTQVDLIAVPGLGSHPLGSWKSSTGNEIWLRDYVPGDIPNCRVMIYGYDTKLQGNHSKQSIEDLGGACMESITTFRADTDTSQRPIIFIGHSLGGLLIKEALIRARKRSGDISNLHKACYGMFFFGVPNLGLRNDQLRTIVQGQPNQALIDSLIVDKDSEPSNFLRRISDQFSETCKGQYLVVNFFERKYSPTIQVHADGALRKTGEMSLLVTKESATKTGLVAAAEEDNIPLDTDHSGLVKYDSRNHELYKIVRGRLAKIIDEAKKEVAERFSEQSLYQLTSKSTQDCLKSLAFPEMDGRYNDVDQAVEGTCAWLLNHHSFRDWISQHRGLLWILGKPGSGKSTLLKYALQKAPNINEKNVITISFFFHGRGHELQRTPLGLFRSLLHQLLNRVPGALPDLVDKFEELQKTVGSPGEKWHWHQEQLRHFLETSLLRSLKRFSVMLFVDALDECGTEGAVKLIEFFKTLLKNLGPSTTRFGICFTCRHYPILEKNLKLVISLESQNKDDIAKYVGDQLSALEIHHDTYVSMITTRASGVFLWAHLVVKKVLELEREGRAVKTIISEIERIPGDLNKLYRELVEKMRERQTSLAMIQWICFAARPLSPNELRWAIAMATATDSGDDFIFPDKISTRVKVLSCGLAEVVLSETRTVQFIHQSVKDFFTEGGLAILASCSKSASVMAIEANYCLVRSCIRYMAMEEIAEIAEIQSWGPQDWQFEFPLLQYAVNSWISHAQKAEAVEIASDYLLDLFAWPSEQLTQRWVDLYEVMNRHQVYNLPKGATLIHIVSRYGLRKSLSLLLNTGKVDVDSKDNYGQTPLSWAAEKGHEAVVQLLLNTGKVDVDSKDNNYDNYGQTPLSWAAKNGHEAVVQLLFNTGKVDVASKDNYANFNAYKRAERFCIIIRATIFKDFYGIEILFSLFKA
ncbi:ankyrin repeat-containing protein [Xylariaceae sp. FL1651]|nr:ankyrin repeat-containing protein [Xylariaceae sp. FL1651]